LKSKYKIGYDHQSVQSVAGKLSCRSTALKRCTKIEILWYRKLVSRATPSEITTTVIAVVIIMMIIIIILMLLLKHNTTISGGDTMKPSGDAQSTISSVRDESQTLSHPQKSTNRQTYIELLPEGTVHVCDSRRLVVVETYSRRVSCSDLEMQDSVKIINATPSI